MHKTQNDAPKKYQFQARRTSQLIVSAKRTTQCERRTHNGHTKTKKTNPWINGTEIKNRRSKADIERAMEFGK